MFAIVQSSTIAFVMLMAYGSYLQFFPLVIASLYLPDAWKADRRLRRWRPGGGDGVLHTGRSARAGSIRVPVLAATAR